MSILSILYLVAFGFVTSLLCFIPKIKSHAVDRLRSRILIILGFSLLASFITYITITAIFAFGASINHDQQSSVELGFTMWLQMISWSMYCVSANPEICEVTKEIALGSPSGTWGELMFFAVVPVSISNGFVAIFFSWLFTRNTEKQKRTKASKA